ncbi:hypothetical protein B0J13DRAFT_318143 [Dactylonectria estremocensis]|uniref:Uncharacterized protein n=1 Tax=Dactylonectria estremocensis TaxID=1079267 RepID=A0A9P9J708_9HYPO|nr:hypothetical protein B0J13DRAFT_318143 [Dactylonectria estremocensis]
MQNTPTPSETAISTYERNPGEVIRPPVPESFDGMLSDIIPFITKMKGYVGF